MCECVEVCDVCVGEFLCVIDLMVCVIDVR